MQSCSAHRPCAKVNGHALNQAVLPACGAVSLTADRGQPQSESVFPAIYDAYAPLVRWCLRHVLPRNLYNAEGDDLTQEVFLRLIKHDPMLPTHADRVRWLTTVTRNVGISARRKRRMTTNCEILDRGLTATK